LLFPPSWLFGGHANNFSGLQYMYLFLELFQLNQ
jgi:hypothetical protein